ncbi:MAG: NAD-dependent epimerase/dehydratase family protein [Nitrospirota bacterium]
MKAFVTGGTGFIGGHVVDLLLENGHSVKLLSRKPDIPAWWRDRDVKIAAGDLREPGSVVDAMQGADVVFHIGEVRSTTAGNAAMNAGLVERMVIALKASGVKRMVFVSSVTVAGIPLAIPGSEDTPAAVVLRDQYTEYKRKAEELIRQSGGGVEYAILRPGVVYGPRSRHLGGLVDAIRRFGPLGLPFIGTGANLMPLIHVKDLARAIYLAGTVPAAAGRTLNITDGERRTWLAFFSAIAEAQRKRFRIIPVHPALAKVPAMFMDLFTGVFGQSLDLPSYVTYVSRDVHFDNGLARTILGWEPAYRDLRDAARDMVAWYAKKKEHGHGHP